MSEVAQIHMSLKMPEAAGVILHALESMGLDFVGLLVELGSFGVPDYFHVGAADGGEYPASVEVVLR
jgi:hypothetical protein